MNKSTKILFGVLLVAVALAVGNVIAGLPSSSGLNNDAKPSEPERKMPCSIMLEAPHALEKVLYSDALGDAPKAFLQIDRLAYAGAYNPATRLPVWIGWVLKASNTEGPYGRKGMKFVEDETVPVPRATNMDYVNSGYDRGHMCPAGDNHWLKEALEETFIYTNCCPQLHSLNAGDWKELEERCRRWAVAYDGIYIVCGPVLLNKRHKTIGRNKVVVPEAFFKVVLRIGESPQAIGFIYRNDASNKTMSSYVNSVDEVERITGLDFFAAMPDDMEKELEAKADLSQWE